MGKTIVNGQEVWTSSQMAGNVAYPVDDEYETMQDEINNLAAEQTQIKQDLMSLLPILEYTQSGVVEANITGGNSYETIVNLSKTMPDLNYDIVLTDISDYAYVNVFIATPQNAKTDKSFKIQISNSRTDTRTIKIQWKVTPKIH